ncbi:unnamed protein product [Caenorhabditis angaria]|uniref:HAT C-terminal dimerisation domain-containing protein n=1 Tax=Caenorhabditis angaria TaxID=860376 RepID=A0A9P1IRZ8_9PELO|nr:unnamed protein product [Caenorhabditis angaria]
MGKYDIYLIELPNGGKKCKICRDQTFKQQKDSSTNVYRYHFLTHHPDEYEKINGKQTSEPADQNPAKKAKIGDETIIQCWNEFSENGLKTIQIDRAIMQFISGCNLPINIVENPSFKNMISVFSRRFNLKSRTHFTRNELPKLYEEYKCKLIRELSNVDNMCISFDGWSDTGNKHEYLAVVAHFTKNDENTYRIIGAIDVSKKRHTSNYLKTSMEDVLKEFQITDKVVVLIRDGAANAIKAAELMDVPHYDCLAHKINLAVKDGLDVFSELSNIVGKLRTICTLLNKSSVARKEYVNLSELMDIPVLFLKKHIEVRWNSVYAVCERALKVKTQLALILVNHPKWPQMTDGDWETVVCGTELLKPLVDATMLVQHRQTNASAIIPLCSVIISELESSKKYKTATKAMSERMKEELEKYEKLEYLNFSTLLDPRFKNLFVNKDWEEKMLAELIKISPQDQQNCEDDDGPIEEINVTAENIFSKYMKSNQKIAKRKQEGSQTVVQTEFKKWLDEAVDINLSPTNFWAQENNIKSFPHLHQLSQKYLCSPASTAESERLFSTARLILSDNRKNLGPANFSKHIFLSKNMPLMGFAN